MKTQQTILIALATLIMSASLTVAGSTSSREAAEPGWFKRHLGSLSWNEAVTVVQSPRDASFEVKSHLKYKTTVAWSTGEDAWTRGYGDCKDFAACVKDMCIKKGFNANIYVLHTTTGKNRFMAHAVVVGTWNNETWMSSNGYWYSAKTFEDVKKLVVSGLRWKAEDTVAMPLEKVTILASSVAERKR